MTVELINQWLNRDGTGIVFDKIKDKQLLNIKHISIVVATLGMRNRAVRDFEWLYEAGAFKEGLLFLFMQNRKQSAAFGDLPASKD